MKFKWCLFRSVWERAACVNNDVRMHCLAQCMRECILAFAHVHMAKMAVNSLRMFLRVNWPLAVICLCTSHTVTFITFTNKHTLQHKDTRDQWGRAHWLVWGGRGLEWRGDQAATMQSVKSMDSFFLSLIVCSWHQSKIKNTKTVVMVTHNWQWTIKYRLFK